MAALKSLTKTVLLAIAAIFSAIFIKLVLLIAWAIGLVIGVIVSIGTLAAGIYFLYGLLTSTTTVEENTDNDR